MGRGSSFDAGIAANSRQTVYRLKADKKDRALWTDKNIQTALGSLADQLGRFPTDQELHDYGLGGARTRLRDKGLTHWGKRIGYPARRQGEWMPEQLEAAKIWTDETILSRLRELHQGKKMMMGMDDLRASKYPGLATAVSEKGQSYWADKLDLETLFDRWDDQTIQARLCEFLKDFDHFPSQREFRSAGQLKLHAALRRHHGVGHWVTWSGLPRAKAGKPLKTPGAKKAAAVRWTEQTLGANLDKFLAGWDHFPSQREFKDAGEGRLLEAMRKRKGVDYWVERSGLPRAATGGYGRSYSAVH